MLDLIRLLRGLCGCGRNGVLVAQVIDCNRVTGALADPEPFSHGKLFHLFAPRIMHGDDGGQFDKLLGRGVQWSTSATDSGADCVAGTGILAGAGPTRCSGAGSSRSRA